MYSGYKKDDTNDFLLGKRIEAKHIETENESSATVSLGFDYKNYVSYNKPFSATHVLESGQGK